jgi:N-formylglutamate amidohydrolase
MKKVGAFSKRKRKIKNTVPSPIRNWCDRTVSAIRIFFRQPNPLPNNVLLSASHGSARIPVRIIHHLSVYYQTSPRLWLNYSDYGTKFLLEDIDTNQKAIPKYGRIVGDPNRDPSAPDLIRFTDFGENRIFSELFERRLTRSILRFFWRRKLLNYSYNPFYKQIYKKLEQIVKNQGESRAPIVFIDVHDVGNRLLGRWRREDTERKEKFPKVMIANAPDLETGQNRFGTAPDYFVDFFAEVLADKLGLKKNEVKINHVYKGGNIIRHFGNPYHNAQLRRILKGREIFALQLEFNRAFYLNEVNQIRNRAKVKLVKNALMNTLNQVCDFERDVLKKTSSLDDTH